ncbi:uncharacterized protein EAE97_002164 [Botrytis byssoidea]|uniref:Uncharacterized protein n=1 Tax=Botrytis byssoidea TaxID=139641 RepID=A0A9P5LXF6_9HELO|nr:uncharacterized protein EAE97_002164 [Botrytis byssoidea]KAF7950612.1 hypothetical protein EAE97_002164 [Botrytis byssoidea]
MSGLYRCVIGTLGVLVVGGEFGGYIGEVGRSEEADGDRAAGGEEGMVRWVCSLYKWTLVKYEWLGGDGVGMRLL